MTIAAAPRSLAGPSLSQARQSAVVAGLIVVFCFVGPLLSDGVQDSSGGGNLLRQLCYIGGFGAAVLTSRAYADPRRLLVTPLPVLIALLWCLLSISWSVEPSIGARRFILTATIIWSLFIAVEAAGFERTLSVIRPILALALAVNFAAVALLPHFAIHQAAEFDDPLLVGDWKGILMHKNFAGPACAYTVLCFGLGNPRMKLLLKLAVMLAAGVFLYKTGSKTSIAFTGAALAVGWLFERYDPRFRALIPPVVVAALAIALYAGSQIWPQVNDTLLRPEALSGRGQIWVGMLKYAQEHVFTGSGFGSFWNAGPNSPARYYAHGWLSQVSQGHNGYLDILVAVGAPGLILIIVAMIVVPMGRLLASRNISPERRGLLLAMIFFAAGHNLTESTLFDRDMITQAFLTIAIALTYVATRPGRDRDPV